MRVCRCKGRKVFGTQRHVKTLSSSTAEGANRAKMKKGNNFAVFTHLGLKHVAYEERVRHLVLFSLKKSR